MPVRREMPAWRPPLVVLDLLLSQLQGLKFWVVMFESDIGGLVELFTGRFGSGIFEEPGPPPAEVKTVPRWRSRLGRKEKLGRSM